MKTKVICAFLAMLEGVLCMAEVNEKRMSQFFLIQGVEAYQKDDLSAAERFLKQSLDTNPGNDAAHYYLGYVSASKNDAAGTIYHFEQAYRMDTTNVWYARRLAAVYTMLNRKAAADSLYSSLLHRKPDDVEILSSLVDVYLQEGNYEKADSLLQNIVALRGPSDYTILSHLEILRMQGKFKEFFEGMNDYFKDYGVPVEQKTEIVDELLKTGNPNFNYAHISDYDSLVTTCLRVHPDDTSALHYACEFYYAAGKKDKILDLYETNWPDYTLCMFAIYVHIERKEYKEALDICDVMEAMVTDQEFSGTVGPGTSKLVSIYSMRADCYQFLGWHNKAVKAYEAALKLDPNNSLTLNNYAYYLACRGQHLSKCEKMSKRVILEYPENATYLDTYAWILHLQKKYAAAKVYFKKAMMFGGKESSEVLEHYAATLEALGETDLAEGYRQQAKLKREDGK